MQPSQGSSTETETALPPPKTSRGKKPSIAVQYHTFAVQYPTIAVQKTTFMVQKTTIAVRKTTIAVQSIIATLNPEITSHTCNSIS